MTRTLALCASMALAGCAGGPTTESLRPRHVNVYAEHGKGHYGPSEDFTDYRFGVSVQFDLIYADEWEEG